MQRAWRRWCWRAASEKKAASRRPLPHPRAPPPHAIRRRPPLRQLPPDCPVPAVTPAASPSAARTAGLPCAIRGIAGLPCVAPRRPRCRPRKRSGGGRSTSEEERGRARRLGTRGKARVGQSWGLFWSSSKNNRHVDDTQGQGTVPNVTQVDAQLGASHLRKWEGLRPMTTGPHKLATHTSVTKMQKHPVQKVVL
jgi:hypothetical protein